MSDALGLERRRPAVESAPALSRRAFGKLAAASAVFAMAAQAGGGRASPTHDAGEEPASSIPPLDRLGVQILELASLAPNGHNTQPWEVAVHDARDWTIRAVESRRLPAVDPEDRELTLSIGAFAENLVLAASALGLAAELSVASSEPGATRELVRVRLHDATPGPYPLARIRSRRTVRRGLGARELRESIVKPLCAPLDGSFVYFPRASREAARLAEATLEANRKQAWRDDAQRELASWLRFDDGEAARLRDGLSTAGMEITGLAGWYVRHFMEPEDAMTESFRSRSIDAVARMVGEGGGWIVVLGDGSTRARLVETGRRFEAMALLAREHGVGIHPMTQVLEEEPWRTGIASALGLREPMQFVLRVGRVDSYPDPVTLRRRVGDFVVPV